MEGAEERRHTPIEELDCFRMYEGVSDWVWEQVEKWKPRHQDTIGKQLVRAADSVGANLVEGDARYSHPESIHFFRIARGSARETRLWIRRAGKRSLVDKGAADQQIEILGQATKLLNLLIGYRLGKVSAKTVRESRASYNGNADPLVEVL
jgi:four helix bundle protein